jgi:hypothetical protein
MSKHDKVEKARHPLLHFPLFSVTNSPCSLLPGLAYLQSPSLHLPLLDTDTYARQRALKPAPNLRLSVHLNITAHD